MSCSSASKPAGLAIAVVKKFGDDQAGSLAALVAYYAFFSLFPLLLLFVTILGFVLQGNTSAQSVEHLSSTLKVPDHRHQADPRACPARHWYRPGDRHRRLAALRAGDHDGGPKRVQHGLRGPVQGTPELPQLAGSRARLLIVFGLLQVVSTVVTGLVAGGFGGVLLFIAGVPIGLALNLVLFFAVFRLLTDDAISTRELRPGIVMASVLWEIVQLLGGIYIGHVLKGARPDLRHLRHRDRAARVALPRRPRRRTQPRSTPC